MRSPKTLAILAVATGVTSAHGSMQITLNLSTYTALPGGEFNAQPTGWGYDPRGNYVPSAVVSGGFETFCIERNETFYQGATYNVALSGGAKRNQNVWGPGSANPGHTGGLSSPGFDALSAGTAWLYSQYAQGLLDYAYSGTTAERKADAGLLQNAIWSLEDEDGNRPLDTSNRFVIAATAAVAQLGYGVQDDVTAGKFGVWAMNTTAGDGTRAQDMLVYAPVPEPPTYFTGVGALGILGLAASLRGRIGVIGKANR